MGNPMPMAIPFWEIARRLLYFRLLSLPRMILTRVSIPTISLTIWVNAWSNSWLRSMSKNQGFGGFRQTAFLFSKSTSPIYSLYLTLYSLLFF